MTNQIDERLYAMEEIARSVAADKVDFRSNVAAGTVLGETDLEGLGKARWRKNSSLQRMGSMELPERVALYNRETGDVSMVAPTIASNRIMKRPHIFTMRRPEDWTEPTPIPETCEICLTRRQGVPRPFFSEYDLETHWQTLHPREYATRQRQEDRDARKLSDDRLADLIEAVVGRLKGDEEAPRRGRRAAE